MLPFVEHFLTLKQILAKKVNFFILFLVFVVFSKYLSVQQVKNGYGYPNFIMTGPKLFGHGRSTSSVLFNVNFQSSPKSLVQVTPKNFGLVQNSNLDWTLAVYLYHNYKLLLQTAPQKPQGSPKEAQRKPQGIPQHSICYFLEAF